MTDDIDDRLNSIKAKLQKSKEIEQNTFKTEQQEKRNDSGNEKWDAVVNLLKENAVVEISKKNGRYVVKAAMPINKWFLISIFFNALLIAFLLIKIIGLW